MLRYSVALVAMVLAARIGAANDLQALYELALTRDATLQAAGFQRDAAIEVRPQALAQWLPQVSAAALAARERVGIERRARICSGPCGHSSPTCPWYC